MERLNPNTLSELDQAMLDRLTHMEPTNLTIESRNYLRARRMYLRPEQAEIFASVLAEPVEKKKVVEKIENHSGAIGIDEETEVRKINPDKINKSTLIQMARDASLDFSEEMTKRQIAGLLNERFRELA